MSTVLIDKNYTKMVTVFFDLVKTKMIWWQLKLDKK